jgi:hypothetical protein
MYFIIQCLKTVDACVTPGFLPSALQIAPGDFVAGMTSIVSI